MNPPATPAEPSTVTARLRRARLTLRLWRQDRHRRDALTLLWLQLTALAGWRTVLAFLVAGGLLGAGLTLATPPPDVLFRALQLLLATAALAAGASLFAEDVRQGTFDLLWLGTGSRRRMLGLRLTALLIVLGALCLGAAFLLARQPPGLPGATSPGLLAHALPLLASTTLILAISAWLRTILPQPLSAAIAAAAVTTALYLATRGSTSAFAPFLSPHGAPGIATLVLNVILLGAASLLFLSSAANRLGHLTR